MNLLKTFLYFELVKLWKQNHKLKYKLATYKAMTNIGIMILLFSHSLSGLKVPSHAMRINLAELGRWNLLRLLRLCRLQRQYAFEPVELISCQSFNK